MKVIEGFHIKKIQRGTKKGQDYINHNKKVCVEDTRKTGRSNRER